MWWTVHIEGGPRRVNHAAVAIGERIFSFGGYCTGDNYKDRRPIDVFVLNTVTYRWSEIPKPAEADLAVSNWPYQRYGHTVIAFGDSVYLFGGRNDESACNTLFRFDTGTFTWSRPEVFGDIPGERDGHSACVIGKHMFVFGGYEEVIERFGQDVYRLDLENYCWRLLMCGGEPPIHRDFHSATAIGQNMLIFGGRSDLTGIGNLGPDYYSNKVCYLDTVTMRWYHPLIRPPLPVGRRSHSALNLDDRLLIFGGYNGRTREHKNDVWMLDPETWNWKELHPVGVAPNPRRRQALCRVGSKIFLFGGTSPYTGPPLYFTPEQVNLVVTISSVLPLLSLLLPTVPLLALLLLLCLLFGIKLALLPVQDEGNSTKLMDQNDLYVLDLAPSLKSLAMLQVTRNQLNTQGLPNTIQRELFFMSASNKISRPLRTVESLSSG